MTADNMLAGKKILIVDDEPDILETLEEILADCEVVKASSFAQAKELLENDTFDIAILDIMGVDGYKLLEIAKSKDIIVVVLTAHALSPEDVVKSYKKGAASFVPKHEIGNIRIFVKDILEAKEKGKGSWWRWLDRLGSFFELSFGSDWQKSEKEFWDMFGEIYK